MRSTKARPIMASSRADTPLRDSFRLAEGWSPIATPMWDDHGHLGGDYRRSRRAFLDSYRLSETERRSGFKEKMKRSAKGINEAAMAAVFEARRKMAKKRIGIRVYRFTWPSVFVVKCFVPWYKMSNLLEP
ncbi:hypothetical protein U1Q18_030434 [Sarracenia purpurea var. burkii]